MKNETKNISVGELRLQHLRKAEACLIENDWQTCTKHMTNILLSIDEKKIPDIAKNITQNFTAIDRDRNKNLISLCSQLEDMGFLEQHIGYSEGTMKIQLNAVISKLKYLWQLLLSEGMINE